MGQVRGAAWIKNLSLKENPKRKKVPRKENRSAAHDLGSTQPFGSTAQPLLPA